MYFVFHYELADRNHGEGRISLCFIVRRHKRSFMCRKGSTNESQHIAAHLSVHRAHTIVRLKQLFSALIACPTWCE